MPLRRQLLCATLASSFFLGAGCRAQTKDQSTTPQLDGLDYPIMPWEVRDRSDRFSDPKVGLKSLLDCGYTLAGFVRADQLPLCEKLHVKAIVRSDDAPVSWEKMSDQQIEQSLKTLIDRTKHSPAVVGYFITDEPGVQKFHALAKAVETVKKYAPGKLAYINLYPDYATLGAPNLSQLGAATYTEYLEKFIAEVKPQLISWDNYRIEFSMDMKDPKFYQSYFRNLVTVREVAQKHHLPFWQITESNQIRPHTTPPSPANLLMHAYTALAAGADGITWYTYYGNGSYAYAPIDNDGHPTPTWSFVRMVNEQVKVLGPIVRKLRSTGVYFTAPLVAPNLPELPGQLTQSIKCETPLMIGEFSGSAGEKYAMVVNLGLDRSSKIQLTTTAGHEPQGYISPVDASLIPLDKDQTLWLTAGQGALIKLK